MAIAVGNKLAGILQATGLFADEQISDLLLEQTSSGGSITEKVLARGYADEAAFLQALAKAMSIPFVRVPNLEIKPEVVEKLPTKVVFQYNVVPICIEDGALRVATNDPFAPGLMDALRLASGMRVRFALSSMLDLSNAAKTVYGVGADTLEQMIQDDRVEVAPEEDFGKKDLDELDQEASVVKFVNQIIWEAFQDRATDIHLEPMEMDLRIRYRIDGVLHQTPVPPQLKRFQSAIISRITRRDSAPRLAGSR